MIEDSRAKGLDETWDRHVPGEIPPIPASDELPRTLGEFRIRRKLGEGGMGVVYEAEQADPRRLVALKVMRGGPFVSESSVRMFQREVRTLARLEHRGIASLYSSGRTPDGHHWFAMELVRGTRLDEWLQARRPAQGWGAHGVRDVLSLFCRICEAVSYAHQRGVIHRDLKPANIIVGDGLDADSRPTGSGGRLPGVKVLDFGLARITDADIAMSTSLTDLGIGRGTLQYMSPEQLRGNPDEIDVRADIYSLGIVLYEMLTGVSPYDFGAALPHEIARVVLVDPPRPISRTFGTRRLASDVVTIVHKALEKSASRRYASAAALADDIQRYLSGQPILARPASTMYQLRKLVARNRLLFAGMATALFVLVGFGVSMMLLARSLAEERDRANRESARAAEEARIAREVSEAFASAIQQSTSRGTSGPGPLIAIGPASATLEALESRFEDTPAAQAEFARLAGSNFLASGQMTRAVSFLERAEPIYRRLDGGWSLRVHTVNKMLVEAYIDLDRLDDAERIARIERQEISRSGEGNDLSIGYMSELLGAIRRERGDLVEARRLFEDALRLYSSRRYPPPQWMASLQDSLARVALAEERPAEAEPLFRSAISIGLSVPERSVQGVRGNIGLALSLVRQGKFGEVDALLARVLEIQRRDYSTDSREAAEALAARGELELARSRPREARPYLQDAIRMLETGFGATHRLLAEPLLLLARATEATEGPAGALPLAVRALAVREATIGKSNALLAPYLEESERLLRALGRTAEAEGVAVRRRALPGS